MPRMSIARQIDFHSEAMVGNMRNITDKGTTRDFGIYIRSIAAINSLTEVVAMKYSPIATVTTKRVNTYPQVNAKKLRT